MNSGKMFLTIALLALTATGVSASLYFGGTGEKPNEPPPKPVVVMPPAAPVADDLQEFAQTYALQPNEGIKFISPDDYPDSRLDFYKQQDPRQAQAIPRGPEVMIVEWDGNSPKASGMFFGWCSLDGLLANLLKVRPTDMEGPTDLLKKRVRGDLSMRKGIPPEQLLPLLANTLGDALDQPMSIESRDVERKVIVLKGAWKYTQVGADVPDQAKPEVEIFGDTMNKNRKYGWGGSGTGADLANQVALWLNAAPGRKEPALVILDAQNVPSKVSWFFHNAADGTPDQRAKARDQDLVLKHIEEQTGLTASLETRKLKRLVLTKKPAAN